MICLSLSLCWSAGVTRLDECPCQRHLPIYLFVSGVVWTTKLLQNLWDRYRSEQKRLTDEESGSDPVANHAFIDRLMSLFLLIWFLCGHYWLLSIGYPPRFEQALRSPHTWCDKTVVVCALISLVLSYAIAIAFSLVLCIAVFFTRHTMIKRASTR